MNAYEVLLQKGKDWNSRSFSHFQRSVVGSWISEQKSVLILVIPLMRCPGFVKSNKLSSLATFIPLLGMANGRHDL